MLKDGEIEFVSEFLDFQTKNSLNILIGNGY